MDFTDMQTMIPIGALIAIGTLVLTMQKIFINFKKEKEEQAAKILQQAKEEDALLKAKLEAKIEAFGVELKSLEVSVEKDMDHLRETYNNELKNLGSKIEELRSELRNQHGQLVQLLTKMIDPK
jgi:predicted nuclease with TOPRIM domain